MKSKLPAAVLAAGIISAITCVSVHAAGWQSDSEGWRYVVNDEGTQWYSNEWQWIDGNNDGIAERFYFGADGYLKLNEFTPDGHFVNRHGAWVVDGIVQTMNVGTAESDSPAVQCPLGDDGVTAMHDLDLGVCKVCGESDFTEYLPWFIGVWENSKGSSPIILNADGTCTVEGSNYDLWRIVSSGYQYKEIIVDGKMQATDIPEKEYLYAVIETQEGPYHLQYVYDYEPDISKYQRIINLTKYDQFGNYIGSQVLFVRQ